MKSQRLFSLELLRFFAAFLVLFWHYCHFYMHLGLNKSEGIFYSIYPKIGDLAVPLFFMMSGAIFVHNYLEIIEKRGITFTKFMYKRFARLYPLHIITLILTACLQYVFFKINKQYFIYQINDFKHFILHIFFLSHWGFEKGNSFNAPVWSVSNEIFLYICFFGLCYIFRNFKNKLLIFLLLVISLFLVKSANIMLLKSAFAFFLGSLVYLATVKIVTLKNQKHKVLLFLLYSLLLIIFHHKLKKAGLPFGYLGPLILLISLLIDFHFKLKEERFISKVFTYLGNISYSTYLIHFPIQLCFIIISSAFISVDFTSIGTLLTYIIIVLSMAAFSFHFVEHPAKIYLLNLFYKKKARRIEVRPDLKTY